MEAAKCSKKEEVIWGGRGPERYCQPWQYRADRTDNTKKVPNKGFPLEGQVVEYYCGF